MYLLAISMSSLKNFCSHPLPFFSQIVCFLLLSCMSSQYNFNTKPLSFANTFSYFIDCSLILLMASFAMQSFLVWCSPTCSFLLLLPLLLELDPKSYCQDWCQGAYHLFSSNNFMVSGLAFKSLIHSELILCICII